MATASDSQTIADVQASASTKQIAIDKVGVRGLRHPVIIKDLNGKEQHTVAVLDMYVDLAKDVKGTHMSRFIDILNGQDVVVTVSNFKLMLESMAERLDANSGYIEMRLPYFVNKAAPVSGVMSLLDYDLTLLGEFENGQATVSIKIVVPVTSLCPCSKEISDYGAHNQRSHVTITAKTKGIISIEEMIRIVEKQASCELYGLLKRPDEKYVTERAYDNPKFVEDMVRDVAAILDQDDRILAYQVESENFESIHNHSAYALIKRDKQDV